MKRNISTLGRRERKKVESCQQQVMHDLIEGRNFLAVTKSEMNAGTERDHMRDIRKWMDARRAVHDQSEQQLFLGLGFKGKISKGFADASIAVRDGLVGHDQTSLYC